MRRVIGVISTGFFLVAAAALPAPADAQVLDFEGLQNLEEIEDFYNGGTGSMGSSGPNFGIGFTSGALAIIDADDGGGGNFENNPSGETVAFFLTATSLTMNVFGGFTTGFSFFYSSSEAAAVTVWSGLNGTGTLLATVNLLAQANDGCTIAPGRTGFYCNWTAIGVGFAGTAMSVDFAGVADRVGFDNITLNSTTPGGGGGGTPVPEPASAFLVVTGLTGLLMRRRNVLPS